MSSYELEIFLNTFPPQIFSHLGKEIWFNCTKFTLKWPNTQHSGQMVKKKIELN